MNYLVRIPYVCVRDAIMHATYHIKGAESKEEAIERACDAMEGSDFWFGSSPAFQYLQSWRRSLEPNYHYDYEDLVPIVTEEIMSLREFRSLYPYKPFEIYSFGEAVSYPIDEGNGSVWIYARSIPGDHTSARYVALNDKAKRQCVEWVCYWCKKVFILGRGEHTTNKINGDHYRSCDKVPLDDSARLMGLND